MHKTAVDFNGPVFGSDVAIQAVGAHFVLAAVVGRLHLHIVLLGIPVQIAESKFALVVSLKTEKLHHFTLSHFSPSHSPGGAQWQCGQPVDSFSGKLQCIRTRW
jgi:hypothetical protein